MPEPDHILTTHTGSLPRPQGLLEMLQTGERDSAFESAARDGVATAVRRQLELGIDLVNDGKASKTTFATYATTDKPLQMASRRR